MAEEKFTKLSVKENVKQDVDVLAAIERRNAYEVVADAIRLYKAVSYGKGDKKLKKIVESLPETELTIVG
jgi:L-ribulose-5-phosphate 3-epimerase UlaE